MFQRALKSILHQRFRDSQLRMFGSPLKLVEDISALGPSKHGKSAFAGKMEIKGVEPLRVTDLATIVSP